MSKRASSSAERSSSSQQGSKRRRQIVTAACERCRNRKTKCDAQRPQCLSCKNADAECEYTVQYGQTRHDALKARLGRLEEDFQSMHRVLDLLQQSGVTEAEGLLRRIRGSDDSLAFARSFAGSPGSSPARSQDPSIIGASSVTPRAPSSYGTRSPEARQIGRKTLKNLFPVHLDVPDESSFRVAISSFRLCAGKLFHVCDHDRIESAFSQFFHGRDDQQRDIMALCTLSSMAAVGCLYMKDHQGDELKETFYQIAKYLLDSCIEIDSLVSATFCALICMYNVMSRATVALAYIELGISLCKRHHLHTICCPPVLSPERWNSGRRAWRALIFFGACIPATIGYLPGYQLDLSDETNVGVMDNPTGVEDMVQIQMVRIAILMRKILHVNMAFPQLTIFTIETIQQDLRQWYEELPPSMQISSLVGQPGTGSVSAELRRTIFLVHLLYLSTLMLLHRRVASQRALAEPGARLGLYSDSSVDRLANESTIAAEQTARILGLLRDEDGIFERCWIVIFQAFAAGTLLLHGIVQENLRAAPSKTWTLENLDCVARCMQVLAFCGNVDPVARKFEETLRPYYNSLRTAYATPSNRVILDLCKMDIELQYLELLPFDQRDERELADVSLALRSRMDWATATAERRPDALMFKSMVGGLRSAQHPQEFAPCAWWERI